ncbi:PAS-domain containing protein [Salinispirillum marinum]|uniref:histidine kinase n=2 Tax=Saccharospirillaceae TaxID=255527 RepID=A0ABV8BBU0_9GAMM
MNLSTIILTVLGYVAVLFTIAMYGDRRWATRKHRGVWVYGLALGVYCTSWTYYGAVGQASVSGWDYIPIYLGPILVWTFAFPLVRKIHRLVKRHRLTTISDLLASRYGKRPGVALFVTLVCLFAVVPYIALQLKAIKGSLVLILDANWLVNPLVVEQLGIWIALLMAAFAILFGTRVADVTRPHPGLMLAIAFESVVKILALILVSFLAISWLSEGSSQPILAGPSFSGWSLSGNFLTQTLLAAGAILVLPRQFQVSFVESTERRQLFRGRWIFVVYLLITCIVIVPITTLGVQVFQGTTVQGDTYVLSLPLALGQNWLGLFAFLGGFSAAMAMIVVSTVTMSTMLTNDLVLPWFLRRRHNKGALGRSSLVLLRRLTLIMVILMASIYEQWLGAESALTSIGLISFSLIVQLVPPLLLGLWWHGAHARGVYLGLTLGVSVWFFWLMWPPMAAIGASSPVQFIVPLGVADPLTEGVVLSLLLNTFGVWWGSRHVRAGLTDRAQSHAFVDELASDGWSMIDDKVQIKECLEALDNFAGVGTGDRLLQDYNRQQRTELDHNMAPDQALLDAIEKALAAVIGAVSAKAVMQSILVGKTLDVAEVVNLFGESSRIMAFNQKLLQTTIENLDQGVSVIDRHLRLVAWNQRYLQMFHYPKGFLYVGRPIADVVRYNAERGECGPGSIDSHVARRIAYLEQGSAHRFVRERMNGMVLEMKGNPLPGGGFVTTFNDITEFVATQNALTEAKEHLEERVTQRTEELEKEIARRKAIEADLVLATQEAEEANASKSRFLAFASHDIRQPLNAARLYLDALASRNQDELIAKVDAGLSATETLLSTLLDIARLDAGQMKPKMQPVALRSLVQDVLAEADVAAKQQGVTLRWRGPDWWVWSDPVYLRRIVQNLVTNAIRHCAGAQVLVGWRKQKGLIRLQVLDTGPGIGGHHLPFIFNEFYRTDESRPGVGLGLAVVSRLTRMVEAELDVRSRDGRGTHFWVLLKPSVPSEHVVSTPSVVDDLPLSDVLYVDNDVTNLDAMQALFTQWGQALRIDHRPAHWAVPDLPPVILMDYDLGATRTGLDWLQHWRAEGWTGAGIIVTAHNHETLRSAVKEAGFYWLSKPVAPAKLRALLRQVQQSLV